MDILIGLLIIAVGSFGQSSSYVPIKKVKSWSWESFWLVQGIFAWLVFPLLGAFLAVPTGHSLGELYSEGIPFMSVLYGVLWGVGGLTFGLSMRYLGVPSDSLFRWVLVRLSVHCFRLCLRERICFAAKVSSCWPGCVLRWPVLR